MNTLSLFADDLDFQNTDTQRLNTPQTEGIKYAGSKLKLLPHILSLISKVKPRTVLDGFAGTTRVSQALAKRGYTVVANDISAWSEVFAICYLLNEYPQLHYIPLIEHLNNLPPEDGWFTKNYGGDPEAKSSIGADGLKKPWQRKNTRRLDAIRHEIDCLGLSSIEKAVLVTSLIHALDAVDNTLGHFASYLNEWSARSHKTLRLKLPAISFKLAPHQVHRKNIFDLLPDTEVDLAYFDPPYGSNNEKMPPSRVRYSAYYHVWTSVCLNDQPEVFGKAKRRVDTSDVIGSSIFEEFRRDKNDRLIAVEAIRKLLKETKAKHILLSYSSGGRATAEELNAVISESGKLIEFLEIDYKKNVMANMRWTNEWVKDAEIPNKEFLFLIETK
ncbi:DNA adenine methylase [Chromatium okenii]|jgi:adenine-specific DNA-methyltransferase|uniref:site-specific DNA-methyltransferase (adenine-specific) n=1 Tax=Chromatium okenii TaxID=61644 RepID=A0A2S7XQX3_9GAMM|nr:DNA adenine methylase [Chromatium okenii]MBV5310490.1 DNA adenine methylase [Chromatium okenii]PQJ95868.1 DNA methyltransferase [Chromatium okenii]